MRRLLRSLIFVATLAAGTAPAMAQTAIEQRMTPAEFNAAGLHKLSREELAALNAWLDGTLRVATEKAAEDSKRKVESEHRGFFNFGSSEPIQARLQGEFRGFQKGRRYRLDNGQTWVQTDDASLAGVRKTNPAVSIKPGMVGNAWYLSIEGYNTRAKVQREE